MVHIEQDQPLHSNPEFLVLDASGEYDEGDLIVVYRADDPTKEPYSKFEAKYVVYGNEAYT